MGNNTLLVEERQADIGQFIVGRLLPFRKKRQVGPFTFIDHMGPSTVGPDRYMDVDQHPHIGLSTLTYLFDGAIEHRDSTGATQVIHPGDVGFMTAGKAVSHTERTPADHRGGQVHQVHGYQVWVALPHDKEDIDPHFQFFSANDLPTWQDGDLTLRLIAGKGFGKESPLQVYSDLFIVDISSSAHQTISIQGELEGEIAIVVVHGEVYEDDKTIKAGQMLIAKTKDTCSLNVCSGSRLLLFGGQPLGKEPYLLWNFVSSSKEKLQQAKEDWIAKKFPKVEGDSTYIPFPDYRKKR